MLSRLLAGAVVAVLALGLAPAHAGGDICIWDGPDAIACVPYGSGDIGPFGK